MKNFKSEIKIIISHDVDMDGNPFGFIYSTSPGGGGYFFSHVGAIDDMVASIAIYNHNQMGFPMHFAQDALLNQLAKRSV